jgi:hypothetical protein
MNTHSTRAEFPGPEVQRQVAANVDELIRLVEEDELRDRAETSELMSPIDYAKLRGLKPQKVYYYLRTGKLEEQYCNCGRKCVNVVLADALFEELEKKSRKIPLENAEGDSDEDQ